VDVRLSRESLEPDRPEHGLRRARSRESTLGTSPSRWEIPELDWAENRLAESGSSRVDARCECGPMGRFPSLIGQRTGPRRARSPESTLSASAGRWEIPELDWAENRFADGAFSRVDARRNDGSAVRIPSSI